MRRAYPLVLWFLEVLNELVDLMLDVGNGEPLVEDLAERAISDIEARVMTSLLVRRAGELRRGAVAIGLICEGGLLVHFEL